MENRRVAIPTVSSVMPAKEGSKNNIKRLPGYFYASVVIPAKAGIQWFTQYIPAQRE